MLGQLIEKLLGVETITLVVVADTVPQPQDPCCRYIDQSSAEIYSILGRNCLPGDLVRNAASTPETAEIQYSRI